METLTCIVDDLLALETDDKPQFYRLLSDFHLEDNELAYFNEVLIPKIDSLYKAQILHKHFVYLSLIASKNFKLLELFVTYDKKVFVLEINDPVSLYKYCLYKEKHWISEVITHLPEYERFFSPDVMRHLHLISLVQKSNLSEIQIDELENLYLELKGESVNEFWDNYIKKIGKLIDVTKYCKSVAKIETSDTELFYYTSNNSLLGTISFYTDLSVKTQWDQVFNLLNIHSDSNQIDVFTGFAVLSSLADLLIDKNQELTKKNYVNILYDDLKSKILSIKNKLLQIDLLEQVFGLLFHRNSNTFTCRERHLRFILYLLKSVIEELTLKKIFIFKTPEYQRLYKLQGFVSDGLWRLDLILDTATPLKIENEIVNYMLASAESLIHLCLKTDNFQRAHQVIEIFDARNDDIAKQIDYAETYQTFRKSLKLQKSTKLLLNSKVEEFFHKNPPYIHNELEPFREKLLQNVPFLCHYQKDNETFMNIFDVILTQSMSLNDCVELMKVAEIKYNLNPTTPSGLSNFYKRIKNVFNYSGPKENLSICDILVSPQISLNVTQCRNRDEFYDGLNLLYEEFQKISDNSESGFLNRSHPVHGTILRINALINDYLKFNGKQGVEYLWKVFNYLKAFSKILYIEQNSSEIVSQGHNTSYFELLNFNRSELTGKLLFEKQLDPTEFEKYFGKLKLDFLYHVVGNCFPTINLHVQENLTIEELYHDNMLYTPSSNMITYIQKHNWLLAFILRELYNVKDISMDLTEVRLRTFLNYLKSPTIQHLKQLFDNNNIMAALQNSINIQKIKVYFQEHIIEHDLISQGSAYINDGLETGEEILEDTKTTNWNHLYQIILSLPEKQLRKSSELINLKNRILINLVQDGFEPNSYKYTQLISDRNLRIETIFGNLKKWPAYAASSVIRSEISRFENVRDFQFQKLEEWLKIIELSQQLQNVFDFDLWHKCHQHCKDFPQESLNKILPASNADLLLDFMKLYGPNSSILATIDVIYLFDVIRMGTDLSKVKKVLDSLPFDQSIEISYQLLRKLKNVEYLQFVVDYLSNNVSADSTLNNIQISLRLLSVFTPAEQDQFYCLLCNPLDILEMLIMNTKLDKLGAVLDILSLEKTKIDSESLDALLRSYAEKSLDFRVANDGTCSSLSHKTAASEYQLLQSVDSLNLSLEKREFEIPEDVPRKEEWVANDDVVDCMCCHQVVFSMFNRRHHCRRCGRVVCYNCSKNRMLVPTYGDILVRVCLDCFDQTVQRTVSSERTHSLSESSANIDIWILNDDANHNQIIREEFSYEHAPSTSLCFSIMKYHSKSVDYAIFLLDQCEVMLKVLHLNQHMSQEIDYLLVIKMLKTLAIGAKMVSAEISYNSGAAAADKILSQADLLALLADRGCLALMQGIASQNIYIDGTVLRRLRDKLLQSEQWELALEVSTKAGLDNTGVFSAWGKSCLKSGSLLLAREKFHRCLDKNAQYDSLSIISRWSDATKSTENLSLDRVRLSSMASGSNLSFDLRPTKDPPLLNEIIQILEHKTRTVDPAVEAKARGMSFIGGSTLSLNQFNVGSNDVAIDVLSRLKNLKKISSGDCKLGQSRKASFPIARPQIEMIFYEECIYYLTKYGSHHSIIDFFLNHGDIKNALNYIVDNRLSSESFIELYIKCLKNGAINELQRVMSAIDSSLDIWKDHLKHTCRYLEQQKLLNCLYQLQLYIGDYVRAAMTCIRFYQENSRRFFDLANNVSHLYRAEEHLKQVLEQEQWIEVTSVSKLSTDSKEDFEERTLTNPDLVMRLDVKDVHCHMNTVKRQIEIVNFFAQREDAGFNVMDELKNLLFLQDNKFNKREVIEPPTLFGSKSDQINLAALLILCDDPIQNGFDLALKIIDDFKLRAIKIYCLSGKQLAKSERYNVISQLVNCIKTTGINDSAVSDMLDEMLTQAVGMLIKANIHGTKVEDLIKLIKDRPTKISAYIEAKQLKTAYFLAVKYKRTTDIRRIQREAELLNMPTIKALCQKILANNPQSNSSSSVNS